MKYLSILACLIGAASAQTTTTSSSANYSDLCVDDSSSIFTITGTYSHYIDWDGMSIWIQQTDGEAYIFYFEESLGNEYEAWGLYKCDLASYYMDQADESSDKSPATKEGCQGDPVVFCPALDDDDANSLGDGQSPSDGTLDYDASAVPHFYNCSNWFDYENDMSYPSRTTLTWVLGDVCDDDTDTDSDDAVVAPGEKTDNGTDNESATKMSDGAKAVLWIILSIFIVACLAGAGYFGYHWWIKHHTELRASMAEDGGDAVVNPESPGLAAVQSTSVGASDENVTDGTTLETGV